MLYIAVVLGLSCAACTLALCRAAGIADEREEEMERLREIEYKGRVLWKEEQP